MIYRLSNIPEHLHEFFEPAHDIEIGLEQTLGEHLAVMVDVFHEVRRVLKPSGTLWLNYGDCYATTPNGRSAADTKASGGDGRTFRDKPFSTIGHVLKAKDLCMVPNRLAIALQEDGWWVRSEIIWAKPNPMPESIRDRPATAHEKIFLLTKSERYAYDAEAVRQGDYKTPDGWDTGASGHRHRQKGEGAAAKRRKQEQTAMAAMAAGASSGRRMRGFNERWDAAERARGLTPRHEGGINHTGIEEVARGSRNLRNFEPAPVQVWEMATRPFSEAHFATFPAELAERCLLAGCPKGGTVLDPFGGAGTTALVADRLGLDCTLIELNADYAEIAQRRIDVGLIRRVQVVAAGEPADPNQFPLFAAE
jgi:DNA modification methylase